MLRVSLRHRPIPRRKQLIPHRVNMFPKSETARPGPAPACDLPPRERRAGPSRAPPGPRPEAPAPSRVTGSASWAAEAWGVPAQRQPLSSPLMGLSHLTEGSALQPHEMLRHGGGRKPPWLGSKCPKAAASSPDRSGAAAPSLPRVAPCTPSPAARSLAGWKHFIAALPGATRTPTLWCGEGPSNTLSCHPLGGSCRAHQR